MILDELGPATCRAATTSSTPRPTACFQIAAHESVVPLLELYRACEARASSATSTTSRHRPALRPVSLGLPPHLQPSRLRHATAAATVLDALRGASLPVVGVGKIWDIFAGHGVSENIHTEGNRDGLEHTIKALSSLSSGLLFVNLVDFDMLYGHRRDPAGYACALVEFDGFLPELRKHIGPRDLVMLTADHGNDPTFAGTDHTREDVPLIAFVGGDALPKTRTWACARALRRGADAVR